MLGAEALRGALAIVATFLGGEPDEIAFTTGSAEGLGIAAGRESDRREAAVAQLAESIRPWLRPRERDAQHVPERHAGRDDAAGPGRDHGRRLVRRARSCARGSIALMLTTTEAALLGLLRKGRVALEMHRLIAEQAGHHAVAEAMRFADHSPEPQLERLASERRAEQRRLTR